MADFQAIVDGIAPSTCIMSVEKRENGEYGSIRIITGNQAYIDSIERPPAAAQMPARIFVPNSEYTQYFPRDLNFEDSCYQAAVNKKCLHSYARPDRSPVWFDMTFLPIDADEGNVSYCAYIMEINLAADSQRLSNVPGDIASHALEMAIILRSTTDYRSAMFAVVDKIRLLCNAEYCGIMRVDERERSCSMLAESIAEGSRLLHMQEVLDHVDFYGIAKSWSEAMAGSNCLIVKNDHDMAVLKERNPGWYNNLKESSISSIVMFPLHSHDELLGYIWAVNFNPDDSARIKEGLELVTYVLAAEVDNHLLVDRLKVLSSKDMLTGIMNRNEMNICVERLSNGEAGEGSSVGIVFMDLNGLKTVNDAKGHAAGDALLKDATHMLLEVFDADKIFRAGGDEFVVIESGITEDELAEKVKAVKEAETRYDNVSFAIGSCYAADAREVRRALKVADSRMYEDKDAYYHR